MGKKAKQGDTRVAPNGYHYIFIDGYWLTMQRHVMEQHLGRKLEPGERVSFINRDKTDWRIENLKLTKAEGKTIKAKLARLYSKKEEIEAEIAYLEKELANETDAR